MPTYEYVCRDCGHRFEIFQSFSDDRLTICDVCAGELRKVFAPPAISFKGPGFYATDHGKRAKKPAEAGAKPSGDSKPDAKGDSKGDAKDGGSGSGSGSEGGTKPDTSRKKEATSS
jgi:putative FmdB family regulatory protein